MAIASENTDSVESLRMLLEAVSDSVWEYDVGTGIIRFTRGWAKMLGYPDDRLVMELRHYVSLIHQDDYPVMKKAINDCISGITRLYSTEYRIKNSDGEWKWILTRGIVVSPHGEESVRMIGTQLDITPKVMLEDDLLLTKKIIGRNIIEHAGEIMERIESEEKIKKAGRIKQKMLDELSQIINASPSGICVIGPEKKIIQMNSSFKKIFNIENDSNDFFLNMDNKSDISAIISEVSEKISAGAERMEFEKKINIRTGSSIDCFVTALPFFDTDARAAGAVFHFLDISEMRGLEREMMNLVQTERGKFGEDLHDGLGQELAGISYMIEALYKKMKMKGYPESEDVAKISGIIDLSKARTQSIARGLCPVVMEKGGLAEALEDLSTSAADMFGVVSSFTNTGNVEIEDLNVMTNLFYIAKEAVNNSLKHGSPKSVNIFLSSDTDSIVLKIVDDGIGMTPGAMSSGMGLRIMKHRARMLGGDFKAAAVPGGGTCISVKISHLVSFQEPD